MRHQDEKVHDQPRPAPNLRPHTFVATCHICNCHACDVKHIFLHNKMSAATANQQCFCVCSQVLLLDELTTFLDSSDQDSVLKAVRGIVDAQGPSPVTVLWVRCYLLACQAHQTANYQPCNQLASPILV